MLKELSGAAPGDSASSLRGAADSRPPCGLRSRLACPRRQPPSTGVHVSSCPSWNRGWRWVSLQPAGAGDHRTLLSAGTSEPVPLAGRWGPCAHTSSRAHTWPGTPVAEGRRFRAAPGLASSDSAGERKGGEAHPMARTALRLRNRLWFAAAPLQC